jgi:2-alkyl-3-oxoalkanoate reductase
MSESRPILLVTGAAGFLGGRTAKFFGQNRKEFQVRATSRRDFRQEELQQHGCEFMVGDLTDIDFCRALVKNTKVVIHCAGLSSPFGQYDGFYSSNVRATENLLKASQESRVEKFVFISTPSIYFNYQERVGIKESDPLPAKMVNHYAATKLMAEKLVLEANQADFRTIALRPRAITGAEDTVIFPRALEAHRQGKLKIVGNGENICDFTSVRNVIHAIECCLKPKDAAYGEAYNISDGAPVKLWETLSYALVSLGFDPPKKKVSKKVALFAATIVEEWALFTGSKKEPALVKYSVGILSTSMTMDISKARNILGYSPQVSTQESIDEFVRWYLNL